MSHTLPPLPPCRAASRQIDRLADKYREDMGLPLVQLHEVLGKGATGVVYKGTWRNMTVAVKTIVFRAGAQHGMADVSNSAMSGGASNTLMSLPDVALR